MSHWHDDEPGCTCSDDRESIPAPDPSPAEQAEIDRFGIFAEEEER